MARRHQAPYQRYHDFDDLIKDVAALLAQGQVVGWFQGRMEWGPRALGNRVHPGGPPAPGDAEAPQPEDQVPGRLPALCAVGPARGNAPTTSTWTGPPPTCCWWPRSKKRGATPCPPDYENLDLFDRLYHLRSDVPAITHVDYSARIQTVHKETNERYWRLIQAFKELTGCGLIVNTSFNVRGEPIVCTPEDAYQCFMRTEMDYLVLGDYLFSKQDQPAWQDDQRTGARSTNWIRSGSQLSVKVNKRLGAV